MPIRENQYARRARQREQNSKRVVQRDPQGSEIGRAEDHAISGGHVDEIEVDSSPGDPAGQIGEYSRSVLDIDHDDLALAGDREMRNRQRVLRGPGVRNEDVKLRSLT